MWFPTSKQRQFFRLLTQTRAVATAEGLGHRWVKGTVHVPAPVQLTVIGAGQAEKQQLVEPVRPVLLTHVAGVLGARVLNLEVEARPRHRLPYGTQAECSVVPTALGAAVKVIDEIVAFLPPFNGGSQPQVLTERSANDRCGARSTVLQLVPGPHVNCQGIPRAGTVGDHADGSGGGVETKEHGLRTTQYLYPLSVK